MISFTLCSCIVAQGPSLVAVVELESKRVHSVDAERRSRAARLMNTMPFSSA
jgi:hypothetical protein